MDDSGGIPPPDNRLQDSNLRLKWRLFIIFGTFLVFVFFYDGIFMGKVIKISQSYKL